MTNAARYVAGENVTHPAIRGTLVVLDKTPTRPGLTLGRYHRQRLGG